VFVFREKGVKLLPIVNRQLFLSRVQNKSPVVNRTHFGSLLLVSVSYGYVKCNRKVHLNRELGAVSTGLWYYLIPIPHSHPNLKPTRNQKPRPNVPFGTGGREPRTILHTHSPNPHQPGTRNREPIYFFFFSSDPVSVDFDIESLISVSAWIFFSL